MKILDELRYAYHVAWWWLLHASSGFFLWCADLMGRRRAFHHDQLEGLVFDEKNGRRPRATR